MGIDFDKYRIEFPKPIKIPKLRKSTPKFYRKATRNVKKSFSKMGI